MIMLSRWKVSVRLYIDGPVVSVDERFTIGNLSSLIEGAAYPIFPRTLSSTNILLVEEKVITRHRGKRSADVYYSLARTGSDSFDVVYKLKTADSNEVTRLYSQKLDDEYVENTSRGQPQHLDLGEDPRTFRFRNQTYCLTWYMDGTDWIHFIVNVQTGERRSLSGCVSGFHGKNWIPLPFNNTLYVAFRVHPQLRLFSYDIETSVCRLVTTEGKETVTEYRGGSNGIAVGSDSILTIGHKTLSPKSHVPYLMLINMRSLRTQIMEVNVAPSSCTNFSIFDPTSLWIDANGVMYVGVTLTSDGPWSKLYHKNCSQCWFTMSVYSLHMKMITSL